MGYGEEGTLNGSNLSFNASYDNPTFDPNGYTWNWTGTVNGKSTGTGGDSEHRVFDNVSSDLHIDSTSNFKNHGQYVSSVGGGDDAAHSCTGMPINS